MALLAALALGAGCQGVAPATDRPPALTAFSVPSTVTVGIPAAVGGAAIDPDGDTITYAWTVTPTACGAFDNGAAASTMFTARQSGTCTIRLTATARAQSDSRTADVVVPRGLDHPPHIDAFAVPAIGAVGVGAAVSASASDPDGDAISYAWTVTPSACGAFASAAAASTIFTPAHAGTCTVQLTVTALALTASRSSDVTVCAATGCMPTTLSAVDPLQQPPNGLNIVGIDTVARPLILADLNPAGSGDLFGVFRAGNYIDDGAYYLLLSTDRGASWSYLTASGGTAPTSTTGVNLYEQSLCQDTVSYKVHYVTWPPYSSTARYHRVALSYTNGHISGWSWDVSDVLGPAFDATGSGFNNSARLLVKEILDGAGNHVLVLGGIDQPSSTRVARLVASRTVAGATALAPTGADSWHKLTDGTAAGFDVLCAKNTDTSIDAAAFLNLTSVGGYVTVHESDFTFAQIGSDRSLHFVIGPMFYNDATPYGDIRRWRFSWSGDDWVNDASVNGAQVAPVHSPNKPCLGSAAGTASYAWFSWGDETGIHVARIDASGTWTKDAIASPDPTAAAYDWWYVAINVAMDESRVWAYWERIGFPSGLDYHDYRSGYSGGSWDTAVEDTSLFNTPSADAYVTAAAWSPVAGLPQGIGVMTYGYADWNGPMQHYHLHVLH